MRLLCSRLHRYYAAIRLPHSRLFRFFFARHTLALFSILLRSASKELSGSPHWHTVIVSHDRLSDTARISKAHHNVLLNVAFLRRWPCRLCWNLWSFGAQSTTLSIYLPTLSSNKESFLSTLPLATQGTYWWCGYHLARQDFHLLSCAPVTDDELAVKLNISPNAVKEGWKNWTSGIDKGGKVGCTEMIFCC